MFSKTANVKSGDKRVFSGLTKYSQILLAACVPSTALNCDGGAPDKGDKRGNTRNPAFYNNIFMGLFSSDVHGKAFGSIME